MPELSPWDLAGLTAKLGFYIGLICCMGSVAAPLLVGDASRRFLTRNLVYGLLGSLLAFHGVLLFFLFQIGSVANDGMAGMLDPDLMSFYLQTPVGDASIARLFGLLLLIITQIAALVYLGRLTRPPTRLYFRLSTLACALGLAVVVHSFRVSGHLAVEADPVQLALLLHVLTVGLWIGMLYPLVNATAEQEPLELKRILQAFSRFGVGLVMVLLVSALVMAIVLLETPAALWQSAYGVVLMIKLIPVAGLLGLATLNKFRWLQALPSPSAVIALRRSIKAEIWLALVVLAITAVLSTALGPPGH